MKKSNRDLYDPAFVSGMFDRMSKTYGFANLIASFGFTSRWRRQCVNDLPDINHNAIGFDLMSGMGEAWGEIQKNLDCTGKIIAVDISPEMNRRAADHLVRLKNKNIEIIQSNVLENEFQSESADFVVSTFGIKTFNLKQQEKLAREIARILKPGGSFALIEISKPKFPILKWLFMFYLNVIIPIIGRIFLRNSEDYKMLGKYCAQFQNSTYFHDCLVKEQLDSNYKNYFFGCATGVYGRKFLKST